MSVIATCSTSPSLPWDYPISFAQFSQWALYGEKGYYQGKRPRVGKQAGSDFYTSLSLGPYFAELLACAFESLLGPSVFVDYVFVEIGAEPEASLFGEKTPFVHTQTLRLGDPLQLPSKAIVFSNELFDAQPFHRFCYQEGSWKELGVTKDPHYQELKTVFLESPSLEAQAFIDELQALAPQHVEGYTLDLSLQAESLLKNILTPSWKGLFLTFDYGRSWESLLHETPQGTARAYSQHRQVSGLLQHPGYQDLTCDVCWDRLETVLRQHGLKPQRQRQESFFMHHSAKYLQNKLANTASASRGLDPHLQALKALILPPHLGHAFSTLWALRT